MDWIGFYSLESDGLARDGLVFRNGAAERSLHRLTKVVQRESQFFFGFVTRAPP